MNQDKAREYYSAYYEGSLERALRQSLEQRLRGDAQLQAEYRAFERTMDQLDLLKFEEIEVPSYLSDRIATRLETALAADRRRSPWATWLGRYGLAGLAAAALVGAAFGIFSSGRSKMSPASPFPVSGPSTPPSEAVIVTPKDGKVQVSYQSATPRSVRILDSNDQVLKVFKLNANQALTTELTNPNQEATIFEVQVTGNGPDEWIAVQGVGQPTAEPAGSGTVSDLAVALADFYHAPVVVTSADHDKTVTWNLTGTSGYQVAQKALAGSTYDAKVTESGVLSLSDK